MALSPLPSNGFTVSVAAGAPTEANPAPFQNTKEIIILNLDDTDTLLVQFGDPTTAVMTTANCTQVPPSTAISLCVGAEGDRVPLFVGGGATDLNLLFQAAAGGPIDVNVTYVNCRGINSAGGC